MKKFTFGPVQDGVVRDAMDGTDERSASGSALLDRVTGSYESPITCAKTVTQKDKKWHGKQEEIGCNRLTSS